MLITGIHAMKESRLTNLQLYPKYGIFFFEMRDVFISQENASLLMNSLLDTVEEFLMEHNMPSKPRKYGLKIFWACESSTGYELNAVAYGGKEGNRAYHNLAQDIVLKVVAPWYGTGRDVCTDNYFTSYSLAYSCCSSRI